MTTVNSSTIIGDSIRYVDQTKLSSRIFLSITITVVNVVLVVVDVSISVVLVGQNLVLSSRVNLILVSKLVILDSMSVS